MKLAASMCVCELTRIPKWKRLERLVKKINNNYLYRQRLKVHHDISSDYEIMLKWIYKREYEAWCKEEIFQAQKCCGRKWLRNDYYFIVIDSATLMYVHCMDIDHMYGIFNTKHAPRYDRPIDMNNCWVGGRVGGICTYMFNVINRMI